jgi:hypothetical protein
MRSFLFLGGLFGAAAIAACGTSQDATSAGTTSASSSSGSSSGVGGGAGGSGGGSVGCQDSGERPGPRSEMMGALDEKRDRVVFFGGDIGLPKQCNPAPKQVDELWTYDTKCKQFHQVDAANGPGARARGAAEYDAKGDRLVIFGGRYRMAAMGAYTLYDDVWALDLAAMTWAQLDPGGKGPKPRASTATAIDTTTNELIVFGGNTSTSGLSFSPQSDVWAFDLDKHSWRSIKTTGKGPAARLFHAAAIDPSTETLYVFSGGDANAFQGPFLRDLWALDLKQGTWTELWSGANGPLARISPSITFDKAKNRLIAFGGHDDGAIGNNNDTWSFELAAKSWTAIIQPEKIKHPASGFCMFPADFTDPNKNAPDRRSAHVAASGASGLIVLEGKTDCGLIDDVWSFDFATDTWASDVDATYGEACSRSADPTKCTSLCN